jgi:hypothetical protein
MENDARVLTLSVLSESESFKLQGFGTFKKIFVAASDGRNPQTNTTLEIPSHYKVKFTPAPSFAVIINEPYADLKPKILSDDTAGEKKKQPGTPFCKVQQEINRKITQASPAPVPQREQKQEVVSPPQVAAQTVLNQTVQHAVIEHQIIKHQIVQQQIINQTILPDTGKNTEDAEFDPDYDTDDDDERYVNRC